MSLDEQFNDAQQRVKQLTKRPSNEDLLNLYALFKQGTTGDATGKRPGMMDFKGRAKFDAWAAKRGNSLEDAKKEYIALVDRLLA
ncbi:MAG: acyl-CoA-binding protein [Proteobacteria bacterium]|nr:acyl-CoA-binding protein [Pseudomonadota bacterium]